MPTAKSPRRPIRQAMGAMGVLAAAVGLVLAPSAMAEQRGAAQQSGQEKVNMVIIYGDDPCPKPTGDEITVCARKAESERYRIPAPLRDTPSREGDSWSNRVITYERVSATGTQSCSPAGAGGWTGCWGQMVHDAYAERKQSSDVQFSRLIEKEREKRLSTIDAQAAKTQADVEDAERAYEARQRAKQDPGGGDDTATQPKLAPAIPSAPADQAPGGK